MKHAGRDALASLALLLDDLRRLDGLVEKTPGAFYLRARAFLHFHEDASGLYADVKEDFAVFTRHRVSSRAEQRALLARVVRCLRQRAAGD
jgi:hypothetical protein